jgi:outer membrane protein OmpA-like peptidoglycan-associated protein
MIVFFAPAQAQVYVPYYHTVETRGDYFYKEQYLYNAKSLYENLLLRYKESNYLKSRLAKINFTLGDYKSTMKLLDDMSYYMEDSADLNLVYAQSLAANKQYERAVDAYNRYINNCKDCILEVLDMKYYEKMNANPMETEIKELPINTKGRSEYFPNYFENGFSFVQKTGFKSAFYNNANVYNSQGTYFSDVFKADKDFKNTRGLLSQDLVQVYNQGPSTYFQKYNKMYLTKNNSEDEVVKYGKDKSKVRLNIYFSKKDRHNEFSRLVPIKKGSKNNLDYNYGHPAVYEKGNYVIFMSDMPGGYGGADLYISNIINDSVWSEPRNLGPNVNTPNNEMFPFVNEEGYLFYTSNGKLGYGGYDIFASYMVDSAFARAINLGPAVNDTADETSLIIRSEDYMAYITTNIKNSYTNSKIKDNNRDDIISKKIKPKTIRISFISNFTKKPVDKITVNNLVKRDTVFTGTRNSVKFTNLPVLNGEFLASKEGFYPKRFTIPAYEMTDTTIVLDEDYQPINGEFLVLQKEDNQPIGNAKVKVSSEYLNTTLEADKNGTFKLNELLKDQSYKLTVNDIKEVEFNTYNLKGGEKITKTIFMTKEDEFNKLFAGGGSGADKGRDGSGALKNINYKLDEFKIRPEDYAKLDKLVEYMKQTPNLKVELQSHTDCLHSEDYNIQLSKRRAIEAVNYIVSKGIPKERIFPTWFGETKPKNDCKCNKIKSDCTDDKLMENRRTEFRFTEIPK